jgi:hypothetical protein
MARFSSLAFAACTLVALSALAGCSSGDFNTESGTEPDATLDTSIDDTAPSDVSDVRIDIAPGDSAPPPCATPPCACVDPTPTRCGATCVDTKTDVDHCGSCVVTCGKVDHGTTSCTGGTCGLACDTGFHACSKLCLKSTSLAACGTSCSPCPAPGKNASATCDGSKCGIACYAGFADCTGGTADGCETDLSLNTNCGACGNVCPSTTPNCSPKLGGGFICTSGCDGGTTNCSGACVDTKTSANNCGGCGNVCPAVAHARTTCSSSVCGFVCDTGYHACAGTCVADDSVGSCGTTSCTACATPPHSTPTCDGTSCGYTCVSGFKDCNGLPGDGCETNLSDPKTCGSCTAACPVPPHGTPTCSGGICGFSCAPPWTALGDRCAVFGGAYEFDKNCSGTCKYPNAFTKDCSCPTGFVAETTGASADCNESARNDLVICNAPLALGATFPSNVDWGGAYSQRATSCDPATDCFTPNPYTGACKCPSGTTPITFDVEDAPPFGCGIVTTGGPPGPMPPVPLDGATYITVPTQLVFCGAGPSATGGITPPITFFGAFETLDDGTCAVPDPTTKICACPTGSSQRLLRVMTPKAGYIAYCVPG